MSKLAINHYYTNLERAIQFGKTSNETSVRNHFWNLLNEYARKQNYEVVTEVECVGTHGKKVRPDGIMKNLFGIDIGLWESKDEADSLDSEIETKRKKGYPFTNILFEDTHEAVLFQNDKEVMRATVRDENALDTILKHFVEFRNDTIERFEEALDNFKNDVPTIVEKLRSKIDSTSRTNTRFQESSASFLKLCKAEINPDITDADVREMLIQHILTADIFNKIFDDADFHRYNTIAHELEKLCDLLFSRTERRNLLSTIEHYYDTIKSSAANIADHHEKQRFLKVLYETFYKVYNPKAADRLGVVYTPNEIVKFMIESTDYLLHTHFGKTLADKNVEILDPATGTGTFITALIDYIDKRKLAHKYAHEIHANEVAILPYYIANLNIEYTYKQKMDSYAEFKNLCFVDTLDNTGGLAYSGQQGDMFGLTSENTERIKRQNEKKISVVIGNPPYNAKQELYNDHNKNRSYPVIDKRIKDTYIKHGTAQNQIVVYDMYTRFYRWASDRLDSNGVLAFITNRGFIDSRTFDGFRKCVQDEFNECYIIDTKSDVRANPKIAGTTHNVFGIQTGVAIMFLIKKPKHEKQCKIHYVSLVDELRKEEKLAWIGSHKIEDIPFENIIPDKNNNWINLAKESDWDDLLPLMSKEAKSGASDQAIFSLFSRGVATQRDEWVYDFSQKSLEKKMRYMVDIYQKTLRNPNFKDKMSVKWDDDLKRYCERKIEKSFENESILCGIYRPFVKQWLYFDRHFNGRTYKWFDIFNRDDANLYICMNTVGNTKDFHLLASDSLTDLHFTGDSQCLPLYRYTSSGARVENITDWALEQFRARYGGEVKQLTKEDIFHYVYAVLHNPAYRKTYELNLRREFPRIPFYANFTTWVQWGKALVDLHIGYEAVAPYLLQTTTDKTIKQPKAKLKANKEQGMIVLDEATTLSGIPTEAWAYALGNRSALEWILDQYKEKKPSDPTIATKFNSYRFADYKKDVIDLLKRVCTVSVETMKIISQMEKEN